MLRGDAGPDTLAGLDEHAGADQPVDDPGRSFGRDLKGIAKAVYRDKRGAAVDDFFQNGSNDFGTTRRVATVCFHKASLRSRGW